MEYILKNEYEIKYARYLEKRYDKERMKNFLNN